MDAPPAALFATDPVAFHLVVELHERPRELITTDEAARLTGSKPAVARAALRHLVELGLLELARAGVYREPRRCGQCGRGLDGPADQVLLGGLHGRLLAG